MGAREDEAEAGFCPACWRPVPGFGPGGTRGRPRARCPRCGALERHRFLALLLEQLGLVVGTGRAVLDIAPQRQIRAVLERLAPHAYVGVDLFDALEVDARADLTRLPFADGAFDLIVCYHVLEHIPDDRAAMRELARVLSPGGLAVLQVPWRRNRPTDEDPDAPVDERIRRFGQDDHVRWYGADLEDRLAGAGLRPWRLQPADLLEERALRYLGITGAEAVWLCRRSDGSVPPGVLPDVRRLALFGDGGGSIELEAARREAELARAERDRVLRRRSVRAALALAATTRPLFRVARALARRAERAPGGARLVRRLRRVRDRRRRAGGA